MLIETICLWSFIKSLDKVEPIAFFSGLTIVINNLQLKYSLLLSNAWNAYFTMLYLCSQIPLFSDISV